MGCRYLSGTVMELKGEVDFVLKARAHRQFVACSRAEKQLSSAIKVHRIAGQIFLFLQSSKFSDNPVLIQLDGLFDNNEPVIDRQFFSVF